MKRKRNPDIMNLLFLGAGGYAFVLLIGKISDRLQPGLPPSIGGENKPACDGGTHFQVDGSYVPMSPNNIPVTWTISHCGPEGTYWAGGEIEIGGQRYTAEQVFTVSNDQTWSTWRMSAQLNFGSPEALLQGMRLYIADAGNNRLTSKTIYQNLPIIAA